MSKQTSISTQSVVSDYHCRPLVMGFAVPIRSTRCQRGFTLVELMVVVVLVTIFAGMMTLSVSSSEVRKNRAFYEHLIDSLQYVRLLSAERMQPMGLAIHADNSGQAKPVIVSLTNPYAHLNQQGVALGTDSHAKNAMELSANIGGGQNQDIPTWVVESAVTLPELPNDVVVNIIPLEVQAQNQQALQPWFSGNEVPKAIWFGTGEAAPVRIEIRYHDRLVGEPITIMPNGYVQVGKS